MDFTPQTRAHIYAVIVATVPLLVTLGALTDDVASHVLNIAAAVLAVGGGVLARRNISAGPGRHSDTADHYDA